VFLTADGTPKLGILFLLFIYFLINISGDLGISRVIQGDKKASTSNLGTLFDY
jgi:hypothetical protein